MPATQGAQHFFIKELQEYTLNDIRISNMVCYIPQLRGLGLSGICDACQLVIMSFECLRLMMRAVDEASQGLRASTSFALQPLQRTVGPYPAWRQGSAFGIIS